MHPSRFVCLIMLCHILPLSSAFAQQIFAAPVPAEIVAAKKIFISNAGDDSVAPGELYTGEANRAYNQFYGAMQKSQRFLLVAAPSQADLVVEISTRVRAEGQTRISATLYDVSTHFVLWKLDSWIDIAARRVTADHNFDLAVARLETNLEKLTAPPQP